MTSTGQRSCTADMVDIGPLQEVPERAMRIVNAGKKSFGVVRQGESVYALRNRCPHQGGPLCSGRIGKRIVPGEANVGTMAIEERTVIMCPWHGWEFDVSTGESAWADEDRNQPRQRVGMLPVIIEGGRVFVDVGR